MGLVGQGKKATYHHSADSTNKFNSYLERSNNHGKLITRTFVTTKVKYSYLSADSEGAPVQREAETHIDGEHDIESALKVLGFTPFITELSTEEEVRGMEVMDFYNKSKPVKRPESQQKDSE